MMLASAGIPTAAIKETVKNRLLAHRQFLSFCKYTDPKYPDQAGHIKLMTQKLEEVQRYLATGGKQGIGRLMIFMPPRYWKSQTASRKFPAWVLGKLPETQDHRHVLRRRPGIEAQQRGARPDPKRSLPGDLR